MSDSILVAETIDQIPKGSGNSNSSLWQSGAQYGTYIYVAIFCSIVNTIFAVLSIVENIIILLALRKRRKSSSNLLLYNLALTDLLTGLIVQPLYCVHIALDIQEKHSRPIFLGFSFTAYLLSGLSLMTIAGMSLDRVIATLFPFRYRVNARWPIFAGYLIFAWINCLLVISLYLSGIMGSRGGRYSFMITIIYSLSAFFISYMLILRAVRRQNGLVHPVSACNSRNNKLRHLRQQKVTKSFALLATTLCLMYLPMFVVKALTWNLNCSLNTFPLLALLNRITNTLTFLNSSVNPILYCYIDKGLKKEAYNVLEKTGLKFRRNTDQLSSLPQNVPGRMCKAKLRRRKKSVAGLWTTVTFNTQKRLSVPLLVSSGSSNRGRRSSAHL